MNDLKIGGIITNAFSLGFSHFWSILGALLLYVLTIWIPYLNVGTTIAIIAIIPMIANGESPSATGIFQKKYRENFGEFFLLIGLMGLGTMLAFLFLAIPGFVLSVAWGIAIYLWIDQDLSPIEALRKSNELTYGKKWTIFLGVLLLAIILGIFVFLVTFVGEMFGDMLAGILTGVANLIVMPIYFGAYAHIYQALTADLESEPA